MPRTLRQARAAACSLHFLFFSLSSKKEKKISFDNDKPKEGGIESSSWLQITVGVLLAVHGDCGEEELINGFSPVEGIFPKSHFRHVLIKDRLG